MIDIPLIKFLRKDQVETLARSLIGLDDRALTHVEFGLYGVLLCEGIVRQEEHIIALGPMFEAVEDPKAELKLWRVSLSNYSGTPKSISLEVIAATADKAENKVKMYYPSYDVYEARLATSAELAVVMNAAKETP